MVSSRFLVAFALALTTACTGGGGSSSTGSNGESASSSGASRGEGSREGSGGTSTPDQSTSSGGTAPTPPEETPDPNPSNMRCATDSERDFCYCDNVTMKTSASETTCTKTYSCCVGGKDGADEWCSCSNDNEAQCNELLAEQPSWTRRSKCP
jgi:hypothetical protein